MRAALTVADRLGITSITPAILRDSNHTSIHLAPFPVVARVVDSTVVQELLAVLRDLRSVCVAVWCWADPDRAPEKREAAAYHLRRLQERARAARPT